MILNSAIRAKKHGSSTKGVEFTISPFLNHAPFLLEIGLKTRQKYLLFQPVNPLLARRYG
jgi:hypothetical protein